jgi:hypothetical protein
MNRLHALIGTALLAAASAADACLGNSLFPDDGQLDGWRVLEVEVTGVHLTAYEFHSLVERGAVEPPADSDGIEYLYPTSSTPSFEIDVLVDRVWRGSSGPTGKFTLRGCGIEVPELQEKGLLFISPDGEQIGAVWASQRRFYARWKKELNARDSQTEP